MKFRISNDADRDQFIERFKQIKLTRTYVAEFKIHRKRRTLPQNGLYRLWLAAIQDETGNHNTDMHVYFKDKYLGYEEVKILGKVIRKLRSTTTLNTKQFSTYLDEIYLEMGENGVTLVTPDELHWDEFYEQYKDKR